MKILLPLGYLQGAFYMWADDRFDGKVIDVAIIGAGGIARQVVDIMEACNEIKLKYNILGYIVEKEYFQPNIIVNTYSVLGDLDWFDNNSEVQTICAIGDIELKNKLISKVSKYNLKYINAIHPTALITKYNKKFGVGNIFDIGVIISNSDLIGNHNLFNLQCSIGHDCILGDSITIGPGARISGNVTIGSNTYIGTGATVIEKKQIGADATIGAAACVVNDLPAGSTAVGVPAKIIKNKFSNSL